MEQRILFKLLKTQLNIAIDNWKNVYMLLPSFIKMIHEVYKEQLYRKRGPSKIISFIRIKEGLIKKIFYVTVEIPV